MLLWVCEEIFFLVMRISLTKSFVSASIVYQIPLSGNLVSFDTMLSEVRRVRFFR